MSEAGSIRAARVGAWCLVPKSNNSGTRHPAPGTWHRHLAPAPGTGPWHRHRSLRRALRRSLREQLLDERAQFFLQPHVLLTRRRAREAGVDAAHAAVATQVDAGRVRAEVDDFRQSL